MGDGDLDFTVHSVHLGGPVILAFDASGPDELWNWPGAPASTVVELRDPGNSGYYKGIRGLGPSIPEAADALRALIAQFEPSTLMTCGTGPGAHAALVFGVLLGARRIVAFEPAAHLIADALADYNDRRWNSLLAALPDPPLAREFEVPPLMARSNFGGDAFVLYGTGRGSACNEPANLNILHAQWLALSERVSLVPFPQIRQDLWNELARRGELAGVVQRYLFEEPSPCRGCSLRLDSADEPTPPKQIALEVRCESAPELGGAVYATVAEADPPQAAEVSDELRRWIAENLLLDQPQDGVVRTLRVLGISPRAAIEEVWRAGQSPYLGGAVRLQNRLKKRDWLLSVYGTLGRLRPELNGIERRMGLSRDDFFRDYYIANFPVILEEAIDLRTAPPRWSLDDLSRRFGERTVRIRLRPHAVNRDGSSREAEIRDLRFAECLDELHKGGFDTDFCLTSEDAENRAALTELMDETGHYPEYLEERDEPAGSLRLAPAGSIVPFRHESRNLLLAVMVGRLRVKLVPAWDLPAMRNVWENLSQQDGRVLPSGRPGTPQILECVVEPGDLVFIPVGWWHFLERLEPTAEVMFSNFAFPNEFPPCDLGVGRM